MSSAVASFSCGACGRSFAWKNEYAGKTLKCKCGQPIKVPSAPGSAATASRPAAMAAKPVAVASARPAATAAPAAPSKPVPVPTPASEPEDDFAKLVSEAEYEIAAAPPPPPTTRMVTVAAMAAVATAGAGGPTSPMLGYARAVRTPPPDEATKSAQITDYYAPIALIAAGLITYFFDARLFGIHNLIFMFFFVVIKAVVNLVLVFTGLMIGVKLIDLGLGRIGPAMLKIAAVALLPAALGDIIGYYTMGWVPWGITVLMYIGLMSYLFEMDLFEILIVSAIIWVVQTWVAMLLIGLIVSGLGGSTGGQATRSVAGTLLSSPSKTANDNVNPTYFPDAVTNPATGEMTPVKPADVDQQAQDLLAAGKVTEARLWLDGANTHHISHTMGRKFMQTRVDQIYQAGAKKVYAAGIETIGPDDFISQFLIELPDDPAARKTTLKMADDMNQAIKPTQDDGRKFIVVPVD
jgi:hypothetical protein